MARDNKPEIQVEGWLKTLGVESLWHWDMLVFLDRQQPSLITGEHIARFLGYASAEVDARTEQPRILRARRAFAGLLRNAFIPGERIGRPCAS